VVNRRSALKQYADIDGRIEWNDIVQTSEAVVIELPAGVTMHKTGLTIPPAFGYEAWRKVGADLMSIRNASKWAIGDWWAFGFHTYGSRKKFAEEAKSLPLKLGTLMNYGTVSRCVPPSLRNETLSWSHHKVVASFDHELQRKWLAKAAAGPKRWTVRFLEQKIYDRKQRDWETDPAQRAKYLSDIFIDQAQRAQSAMNWDADSLLLLDEPTLKRMGEVAEKAEAVWANRRSQIKRIKSDDGSKTGKRVRLGESRTFEQRPAAALHSG
jgi:hypothetical protein